MSKIWTGWLYAALVMALLTLVGTTFYLSADTRQTNAQVEAMTKQTSDTTLQLKQIQSQTKQLQKMNLTDELNRAQESARKLVNILVDNGDVNLRYQLIKKSGLLPASTKRSDPIISTTYPSGDDVDIKVSAVTDYTDVPVMVIFKENQTEAHMMILQYDAYQNRFTGYQYYDKGSN
ncbi:hypothetical protein HAU32_10555 [Weissella confusa]|uniref:DUF5590 domain-containing protein n=1 Tax=Weissella fermenti TaxID=2987699 RepID=A0ABT6D4Z1_9LACO|nr:MULTISPECIES: hypothetical protein [Weissella]MBJ7689384.1 hypothetical protein [Weissella confusa]MCW0928008.1 hypothetical protein [Weissella sp. LMG 11983]MDF9300598.1 hypothetical protein [Weissella sp. BK2]